ncbi:hypothetical protein MESS2_10056 [Mesorhizobium metallidurans STM 2683]|uniref:Uncharacterized protein n=1 Tax=Mesorhizobium metallidurans STM 2683 TaxID=1297569 RepID=M5EFB2_9HYPH|nr:hypothetical protein MESS2_10056 [Mesorhizobium metallidurans STM 2683]
MSQQMRMRSFGRSRIDRIRHDTHLLPAHSRLLDLGLSSMSKTVLALWSVNSGFDLAEWQS